MIAFKVLQYIVLVTVIILYVHKLDKRPRKSIEEQFPFKPYVTDGRYVTGGQYGMDPLTGKIGYDHWPFQDDEIAAYVATWLNSTTDFRSLQMVWFDWAKDAPLREKARKEAEKANSLTDVVTNIPGLESSTMRYGCDCPTCGDYLPRRWHGRCPKCEVDRCARGIIATYQVPGLMMPSRPSPIVPEVRFEEMHDLRGRTWLVGPDPEWGGMVAKRRGTESSGPW